MGQKWVKNGSFVLWRSLFGPHFIGYGTMFWSKKVVKKWPKMAKNGLFLVIFDHLLDHFIYVCLILEVNCVHIWVKHEKRAKKVVQKWVISGVPRSGVPPKLDILATKCQI